MDDFIEWVSIEEDEPIQDYSYTSGKISVDVMVKTKNGNEKKGFYIYELGKWLDSKGKPIKDVIAWSIAMKVKELIRELKRFDEDAEVVFELDDKVEINGLTICSNGKREVSFNQYLEINMCMELEGQCWIDMGVKR